MSKPSILIVPGSFAPASLYDGLVANTASKGYSIRALQLPSVGLDPEPTPRSPPSMYEDAEFIGKEIDALIEQGKDIIVISHSYGGMPATQAAFNRGKAHGKAGIVRLAYMTALVPMLGVPAREVLATMEKPTRDQVQMEVDDLGWLHVVDHTANARLTLSDMPDIKEAEVWARKLTSHSSLAFADPLTAAGYKEIPVSYLVCEKDLVVTPAAQRKMIADLEQETGVKIDVTSIQAGHAINITAIEQLTEWVTGLADKA